ncbi:hypothetical protein QQY66_47180 [Streptomyces sp. DG2A-72]|uniref:hypothetical protein n=1 Tax=Streptomyces sp. DG2A-72 TaxID=3051386 RepID=UPI00265BA093|nr:hypothetical protein [Streptomyces sp. DG2A-72]MDO0938936.1 hypothetical protein [Streptomyces sp. DG2A-72]
MSVFVNPGEATGYLIGISPLLADLTAEIAWGTHLSLPYTPEQLPPGWEASAMHAQEALDLTVSECVRAVAGIGEAHVPTGALRVADEVGGEWPSGQSPRDYRAAAMAFAITHELTHIESGPISARQGVGGYHACGKLSPVGRGLPVGGTRPDGTAPSASEKSTTAPLNVA